MIDLQRIVTQEIGVYPQLKNIEALEPHQLKGKKYVVFLEGQQVSSLNSVRCLEALLHSGIKDPELLLVQSRVSFLCLRSEQFIEDLKKHDFLRPLQNPGYEAVVLIDEQGYPTGVIDNLEVIIQLTSYFNYKQAEVRHTLLEYEAIFNYLEEEIFVTDQNGVILRLNPVAEKVCGLKESDLVGKHVQELIKRKIVASSITEQVLKQKSKVNMMQEMIMSGKRILSTAIPIFNDHGELVRVVSTSKDIDQINRLRAELDKKKAEIEIKDNELRLLRNKLLSEVNFIYASESMQNIKELIVKIADTDLSVLIQGESGVGKEVIAKSIHHFSRRKNKPFVKINCGLIPENLLEAELFGYEKGAFTGADKNGKIGKIELANGGTLFLDEIGEMPLSLQVKLLEFLQDKTICRVGGTRFLQIDTRVIAATNCDLQDMVNRKLFRQDLYYRLKIMPIRIPPLRERKEDIGALIEYLLNKFNNKYGISKRLSPEILKTLFYYDWPGNVRELEHVMERIMVISNSELITLEHVEEIFEVRPHGPMSSQASIIPLKAAKMKLEEELVRLAYLKYKSTYKAAEVLQVDQSTVVKLMKKYNVAKIQAGVE
ncbi:MAG: sigma 54-interacting transcriptional regulator [Desulfitobacterium hafniense]|nr:sigma 54-interacting transcriptional regulator [Desulfitobacterium hafniense]